MAFLQKLYDVAEPDNYTSVELPVGLDHISFISGYIAFTRAPTEQKSKSTCKTSTSSLTAVC